MGEGATDIDGEGEHAQFVRHLIQIALFVALAAFFAIYALFLWAEWRSTDWSKVEFGHFPATIGLPAAAVAAFVVCALFRTSEGKIRFKAIGFEFEGASGPIVMWVFCFLAIAGAIRLLWPLRL